MVPTSSWKSEIWGLLERGTKALGEKRSQESCQARSQFGSWRLATATDPGVFDIYSEGEESRDDCWVGAQFSDTGPASAWLRCYLRVV